MDFFKYRNIAEEGGAGDEGTPSLVAKYKNATPGQTSPAPSRQPARKGDKLNAKMDYSTKIKQDDIEVKNTMEAFEDPEAQKSEMALTKLHLLNMLQKKSSSTLKWVHLSRNGIKSNLLKFMPIWKAFTRIWKAKRDALVW